MNNKKWVVYIVRCSDKSLYCGVSNDVKKRLSEHNSGKGAKYTRSRRPVELLGVTSEMTKSEALKLEYRIKQLPAGRKITELQKKEKEMTACPGIFIESIERNKDTFRASTNLRFL